MKKKLFLLFLTLIATAVPLNANSKKFCASFETGFGNLLNYTKSNSEFYINPGLTYNLNENWSFYAGWLIPFVSNMEQLENHLVYLEESYSFPIPSTNLTLTLANDNFFQVTPEVLAGGYVTAKLGYNSFFTRFRVVYWDGSAIQISRIILGQGYTFTMGDFSLDAILDFGWRFEQVYEKYYITPVLILNYNF